MENKDIRVALYVRVSTNEQSTQGYGKEYQKTAFDDLMNYKKNQIPKWVTDKNLIYEDGGFSGKDLLRPDFERMMSDAKQGKFDIIVVWKIDRMSRNLSHLLTVFEELKKYNVSFYSIKENIDFSGAIGRLTFQLFGALAEFEREMIKARTIGGKIASARSGNFIGPSSPYGYKKVKNSDGKGSKLEKINEEVKIIKLIFEWFLFDGLNYSDIARKINELGIKKGEGSMRKDVEYTNWYDTTVKKILTQTCYAGYIDIIMKKEGEEESVHIITPKIISKDIFNLIQIKVKEIELEKKGGIRKYLLAGKITDLETGRKFVGVKRTKGGNSYRRKGFKDCEGNWFPNREIPGETLDEFVWNNILEFLNKPKTFFKHFKKQTGNLHQIDTIKAQIDFFHQKIEEEEGIKVNVKRKEASGRFSDEEADEFYRESQEKIKNFEKNIVDNEKKIDQLLSIEFTENIIKNISERFQKNINKLNDEQKRLLVDMLVDKIIVSEDKEENIVIEIIYKFEHDEDDMGDSECELRDSTTIKKSTDKSALFFVYGASCRARTYDPQVRSLVLFQLS